MNNDDLVKYSTRKKEFIYLHSPDVFRNEAISVSMRQEYHSLSCLSDRISVIFRQQRHMATAGVFDIELNEDGANDSDHSDEEPIKPASEEHVQVTIVASLSLMSSLYCIWKHSQNIGVYCSLLSHTMQQRRLTCRLMETHSFAKTEVLDLCLRPNQTFA